MASALVVGEPGSGVTTFVGLLYTAVVRFGNEESDGFRFHAERESIQRIREIYADLGAGHFPEISLDKEDGPLTFVFGFRRSGIGGWARGATTDDEFDSVPVQVAELPAEEVAEIEQHTPVLDESTRQLLRSTVVVPLVNAALLSAETGGIDGLPMARYDHALARTFEIVARFLAVERNRKARRLYPLFVLTQFDRIPPATLQALEAPPGHPSEWARADRVAFGARLLDRHLPETGRYLFHARDARVVVAPPIWFFSELGLDEGKDEPRIRRRSRVPVGGWEPEYPYEEYRGLLMEIGRLARRGPAVAAP